MVITFAAVTLADIPLMCHWFNQPHVQQFYSLRNWTEHEVYQKLIPYITGEKPVFGYLVKINDLRVAYCQFYHLQDFLWPEVDLSPEIVNNAGGIDLFIGDKNYLGKSFGQKITQEFLRQILWLQFKYCIVDPDCRNLAAIHCYEKIGFKKLTIINNVDALQQPVQLQLMLLSLKEK